METNFWAEGKIKWGVDLTFKKISDSSVWVEFFSVPESARGIGVGRQAWDDFERFVLDEEGVGLKEIRLLAVDVGEGASVPFWEKLGFVVERKQGSGFLMAKPFSVAMRAVFNPPLRVFS